MSFEWIKMHKWEDNIEREIIDSVYEYVCEYYDVEDIDNLNQDQIDEIDSYRNELNEHSIMQLGFSSLISQWLHR